MYFDYPYPWTSSVTYTLLVFLASLLVLHVWLIRWKQLSKVQWKRIDYIWLCLASLALLTEPAKVRDMFAPNYRQIASDNRDHAYPYLKRTIATYGQQPCAKFVRSEASPRNLDQVQSDNDGVCDWLKSLDSALPPKADAAINPD